MSVVDVFKDPGSQVKAWGVGEEDPQGVCRWRVADGRQFLLEPDAQGW